MSGSDKDSQCDLTTEFNGIVMGDVLGKEHNDNSSQDNSTDSGDELRLINQRQEADGAPELAAKFATPESTSNADISSDEEIEELISILRSPPNRQHREECTCETCTSQRAFVREQIARVWQWQYKGLKIRQYVRSVFNAAIESPCIPNIQKYECDPMEYAELKEIVNDLVKNHPHKFFLMLVIQAHEFVVELKIRIMRPLQGNKTGRSLQDGKIIRPLEDNNLARIAEIFLARLLNGYDILIATALQVQDLIKPLEEKHLRKFELTWEFFNKKLYQNYIYFYEPTIRNILPSVVSQLRKPRRGKGYQVLLERYLAFVDEMMRIAGLWPEKELLIDKYSSKQIDSILERQKKLKDWTVWTVEETIKADAERTLDVPGVGLDQTRFDAYLVKWVENSGSIPDTDQVRKMLDDWGREAYQTLAQNFLAVHWLGPEEPKNYIPLAGHFYFGYQVAAWLVLSRPSDNSMEVDTECSVCQDTAWVSHLVVGGRTKDGTCAHPTMRLNSEVNLPAVEETLAPVEPPPDRKRKGCLCTCRHLGEWQGSTLRGLLAFPPCLCMLNMRRWPESVCPCIRDSSRSKYRSSKSTDQVATQTTNKEVATDTKKITNSKTTTQTQTRHSTTQTPSAGHNHNHPGRCSSHSHGHGSPADTAKPPPLTHKASHTHNGCHKQSNVAHIKRVQSCNSASPTGDGNSSDSGSNDDSCSTGGTSSPRDNGRNCDCCYCEVFGHGVPSVAPVSRNYNETRERLRQLLTRKKATKCKSSCSPPMSPAESVPSNTNSESLNSVPRSNTPVSTTSTVLIDQPRDHRDLDALVEFIEGNQRTLEQKHKDNNKKLEKKARQKQKKLDELMQKHQYEVERQKIIELQKKTPEVTITVVDPQKPVLKNLISKKNIPEVSILSSVTSQKTKIKQIIKPVEKNTEKIIGDKNSRAINKLNTFVNSKIDEKSKGKNHKNHTKVETIAPVTAAIDSNEPEIPLTKKQRKKLKREIKKMEDALAKDLSAKVLQQVDNQPQIVTIKRVMESNCTEPTVTITLKGQTPAEDKVLFTLVNGQTKEPSSKEQSSQNSLSKKKKKKNQQQQQQQQPQPINSCNNKINQQNNQLSKIKINAMPKNAPVKCNEKISKSANIEKLKVSKEQQLISEKKTENKSIKSLKKDKKNAENKQPVQQLTKEKNSQSEGKGKKQQNKSNVPTQPLTEIKVQTNMNNVKESSGKKVAKSDQQNKSTQSTKNKTKQQSNAINPPKSCQTSVKQAAAAPVPQKSPSFSSLGSQLKDASSKINIENLKLPPGITITKVDVPTMPLPIKSTSLQKPATVSKQATIIAAPMTGIQSNYGGSQAGGNVIVVDTGRLKQDLIPKNDKEAAKDQAASTSSKKKKKKKNNAAASTNSNNTPVNSQKSEQTTRNTSDHAKIVHNPGSNMVTIRNPAFGAAPKMEPLQQAAIIKLSDNGMVTIRSPALQQAINAGLTPPPKPDFIVKGDFMTKNKPTSQIPSNSTHEAGGNGIITSSLAELRSRLTPDCTGIKGLANIQISKVTNGQPIPENGISLKGTSVTLTKVRNPEVKCDDSQVVSVAAKGKKKKKRGNGARPGGGDDWNLVESVFTPKDIDLEDGEMDDAERELEAFKRFCLQSVPPPRKEKVNLNLKDIVLKKKSSAIIAAN